ncbi:MAG: hypothetical protein JWO36_6082 [Myxococcales bacterium]|nr:hypothetical protein [Myxococcales bacterium]
MVAAMKRPATGCLVFTLLTACGVSSSGGPGDPNALGTPENPVPVDKGAYRVVSKIDLTVEAILPPQAELVVATLRDFSINPAHAMLDLAEQAGVPAIGILYGVIPSALKNQLEGWINGEISKVHIAGKPVTTWAGEIAGLSDTALSQFAVDSTLSLDGDQATHTLDMIDFSPAGVNAKLPITGLAADILTQHPELVVAEGGALTFGDQHFGLQFGEYAWNAINAACTAKFGADIRTTLGTAINCPNLAQSISNKCILGICVGHKAELTSICEGGLDLVVNGVHDGLAQLRIDVFHYASGTAHLIDDDQDGVADRIAGGTWDAEMNLGLGLRHTPATFTATR